MQTVSGVAGTERAASDTPDVAAFIDKWRAREPEMVYAEVFCPRHLHARFVLWGALLFELRAAAFELSDARLIEAKCAWWADELLHCAQGAPRHPLTKALATPELPWNGLARGMLDVAHADVARPADRAAALAAVMPLAESIGRVEAVLFNASMSNDASTAVAIHLLGERLRIGLAAADAGRVPLTLLARHGVTAASLSQLQGVPAVSDWAAELVATLPSNLAGIALYRRTRTGFDTWFLRELAANPARRAMPSLRALWLAWRAARQ